MTHRLTMAFVLRVADWTLVRVAALALTVMLAMVIWSGLAQAQDVVSSPQAAPLSPFVWDLLATAAVALAAPIAALLVRLTSLGVSRMGFDLDESRRARLQQIVEGGILGAAARRGVSLQSEALSSTTRDSIVNEAVAHVAEFGADTVKKLKGDPEDAKLLKRIVEARGGLLLAPPSPAS